MRFTSLFSFLALGAVAQAASGHGSGTGLNHRDLPRPEKSNLTTSPGGAAPEKRKPSRSRFLNKNTERFVVNGSAIPDVNFDVGESYAGLLPISKSPRESRELFFWFFPSSNPDAGDDELVIWLNGGPGCSSLSGLMTENGPFLWQQGTFLPVRNTYSWTNLTNVIWIEQPVGTGFTQGTPNITNELQLRDEFAGFWRNFIDAFKLHGVTTYITGESYAGTYIPYIADYFIAAADDRYYKLGGLAINDPLIGDYTLQEDAVTYPYVEYWQNVFNLNETFMNGLRWIHEYCNYSSYLEEYATFPPTKKFPVLPDPYSHGANFTCGAWGWAFTAALEANPCFNVYHITDMCPFTYSQLGIVNPGDYSPPGAVVYFNRTDVQDAINAPHVDWNLCALGAVFGFGNASSNLNDTSVRPAQNDVLQRVIEHLNNTIIGTGRLDFLLPPNGTLYTLQNVTWNGLQGFQKYPQDHDFYVPYHDDPIQGRLSESGTVGQWGYERGLTYYEVQLAGHELPGYSAGSGYRLLEVLLGRVKDLSSRDSFTGGPSPTDSDLGNKEDFILDDYKNKDQD